MNSINPSGKDLLSSCSAVGPEDGTDPRDWKRAEEQGVKNRKAIQLCAQVADTLRLVLAGECADDVLRELVVESVVPASNSSQLLVTVSGHVEPVRALEHLKRASGWLRSEVAAAIHRRRTPRLSFRVLPPRDAKTR